MQVGHRRQSGGHHCLLSWYLNGVLGPSHMELLFLARECPEQEEVPESRDPCACDQLHGGCLLPCRSVMSAVRKGVESNVFPG